LGTAAIMMPTILLTPTVDGKVLGKKFPYCIRSAQSYSSVFSNMPFDSFSLLTIASELTFWLILCHVFILTRCKKTYNSDLAATGNHSNHTTSQEQTRNIMAVTLIHYGKEARMCYIG